MHLRFDVVPLVDGDVLLLAGEPGDQSGDQAASPVVTTNKESGLLDASEVAQVLGEVIAGGLTFEALKALARRVRSRGATPPVVADISQVRDAVVDYLTSSGYSAVIVTETHQVTGRGWSLEGKADSRRFTALTEESGQVVHVRVR